MSLRLFWNISIFHCFPVLAEWLSRYRIVLPVFFMISSPQSVLYTAMWMDDFS